MTSQTILEEFVQRAKDKVNPSHLDWFTVTRRLTKENGFDHILNMNVQLLMVNPRFDPDNVVDPSASEWMITWATRSGELRTAPDLFYVWWNDPTDLKYLVEAGHLKNHFDARRQAKKDEWARVFSIPKG